MVALGTPTELKQRSMKGELLLIECEPLGVALETLQQAPDVLDAAVFGNALHVRRAERAGRQLPGYERIWRPEVTVAQNGTDPPQPRRCLRVADQPNASGAGRRP